MGHLHIATPSQWLLDRVEESGLFSRFPMRVIPNGIDLTIFQPASRAVAKQALGIPRGRLVVMLGAKDLHSPFKGVFDGIEAINRAQVDGMTVLLVGSDAEEVAGALRCPQVSLPYQRDRRDVARCYQAADVVLVPSKGETFGLVAAEAMACGAAVLACAVGGLPEVIGSEGAGVLVPPGDTSALTRSLKELVSAPGETAAMGRRAAQRAARCFAVRLQAERFAALYSDAIAARPN